MTIREKLDETQKTIQTYYSFGEFGFNNLSYYLGIMKDIMAAYGEQFPELKYHIENNFLKQLNAAFDSIKYQKEHLGYQSSFDVQNNTLNDAKSNSARAYWGFVYFVNSKQDGFFEKTFNGM